MKWNDFNVSFNFVKCPVIVYILSEVYFQKPQLETLSNAFFFIELCDIRNMQFT
jgi:hypothetical protein